MELRNHIEDAKNLREQLSQDLPAAAKEIKLLFSAPTMPSRLRTEAVMFYLEVNDLDELEKLRQGDGWTDQAHNLILRGQQLLDDYLESSANQATMQPQMVQQQQVRDFFQELAPAKEPVFVGKGMVKTYRSTDPPFTLGPIDLELNYGQITGVVGENGNGKSTLLRMVAGMVKIDGGELAYPALCQQPINWHKVKGKIGYIPQRLEKWSRSVHENLRFYAAIHGIRGKEADQEIEFILRRMNLHSFLHSNWENLSGGYQMRFEIARALIAKPRLLILDEPLANLDVSAQSILLRDLRYLVNSIKYPLSVLLSSQHLHKVENVSDRVVFLRAGKAIFNGPTSEIGINRQENFYEVGGEFPVDQVRQALSHLKVHQVRDDGQTYLIRTATEVSAPEILQAMMDKGVPLQFFRDISRSTRQFFEVNP